MKNACAPNDCSPNDLTGGTARVVSVREAEV